MKNKQGRNDASKCLIDLLGLDIVIRMKPFRDETKRQVYVFNIPVPAEACEYSDQQLRDAIADYFSHTKEVIEAWSAYRAALRAQNKDPLSYAGCIILPKRRNQPYRTLSILMTGQLE